MIDDNRFTATLKEFRIPLILLFFFPFYYLIENNI